MRMHKKMLDVFEGEAHEVIVDGEHSVEHYSYVFFHEKENIYRHFKTFDTYKEAYALMLKMFLNSDVNGMIAINEKYWFYAQSEMQKNIA